MCPTHALSKYGRRFFTRNVNRTSWNLWRLEFSAKRHFSRRYFGFDSVSSSVKRRDLCRHLEDETSPEPNVFNVHVSRCSRFQLSLSMIKDSSWLPKNLFSNLFAIERYSSRWTSLEEELSSELSFSILNYFSTTRDSWIVLYFSARPIEGGNPSWIHRRVDFKRVSMSGPRRRKQEHYSRSAKLGRGSPASSPIKRCERQSLHRVCKVYRRSCELVCRTHPRHSHSAWVRAFLPPSSLQPFFSISSSGITSSMIPISRVRDFPFFLCTQYSISREE